MPIRTRNEMLHTTTSPGTRHRSAHRISISTMQILIYISCESCAKKTHRTRAVCALFVVIRLANLSRVRVVLREASEACELRGLSMCVRLRQQYILFNLRIPSSTRTESTTFSNFQATTRNSRKLPPSSFRVSILHTVDQGPLPIHDMMRPDMYLE